MSKHTPGPWKMKHTTKAPYSLYPRIDIIGNNNKKFIVYLNHISPKHYGKDFKERKNETLANAHLIAAAPELLEVLKDWERNIPRMKDSTPGEDSLRARALRVIAKVEGK